MTVTLQPKRAIFWALGIIAGLALMTVAWAQIRDALSGSFSFF